MLVLVVMPRKERCGRSRYLGRMRASPFVSHEGNATGDDRNHHCQLGRYEGVECGVMIIEFHGSTAGFTRNGEFAETRR